MYYVGGRLPLNASSYVVRQADEEIYRALIEGEFCYLLNCRQMGKSSLRVRASQRLMDEGIACGAVDLSGIGGDRVTPQQWYAEILRALTRSFRLQKQIDLRRWLEARLSRSPIASLSEFLKEHLLSLTQRPTVIFIDEIDITLSLPFNTDDFFSLLRSCYELEGLTFVLLGVATPGDLIVEKTRTPFNIGRAIQLHGFQPHEAQPLIAGLRDRVEQPENALLEVLAWTEGQPFLTQKACYLLREASAELGKLSNGAIPQLIESHLINNWMAQDEPPHLRTIRDRLLRDDRQAGRVLGLYQQILRHGAINADDSPEQIELQLSGLVVKKDGQLQVYNRIYEGVFDRLWVEKQLNNLRPYGAMFSTWVSGDRQDTSQLLRGRMLEEALTWSRDKSLSNLDYQFLTASQTLNQQEMQTRLELERSREIEARLVQEQKTTRVQRILIGAVSAALVAISGLGISVFWQYRQAVISEVKAIAQSSEALFANKQQLEALTTAIEARQQLQRLGWRDVKAQIEVENALRRAVYGIVESNRLSGHEDMVYDVAFSPDGEMLASGSRDRTVRLWQRDGSAIATLEGHQDFIINVTFSPDSQTIASASADGTVKLWSRDGTLLKTLKHDVAIGNVIFSPDGETIASAGGDGAIQLWSWDGVKQQRIPVHADNIEAIAFNPDGSLLVSGDETGTIRFWTRSGKEVKSFPGHSAFIREITFSPDGQTIASLSPEDTLKIWTSEGTLLASIEEVGSSIRGMAFSPDSQTIATVSLDGILKLRTLKGEILTEIESNGGWLWSVAFSPNGKTIAAASRDRTIRLWQPDRRLLNIFEGHQGAVTGLAIAPDGQQLATTSPDDRMVKIWSREGKLLHTLVKEKHLPARVDFSPEGEILVVGGQDGRILLWDRKGVFLRNLEKRQHPVFAIVFAPNGQTIASTSLQGPLKLWQADGTLLQTFPLEQAGVSSAAFSPREPILASARRDGWIELWQLNGTLLQAFSAHRHEIYEVVFAPDGRTFISAARDGTIKQWQLDGTLLTTFNANRGAVNGIALSREGWLASAHEDGSVNLWQLDGTPIATLRGHEDAVHRVAFTPDNKYFVSVGADRAVILWELERVLDMDALLDFSCDWLRDYLRTNPEVEERHRYVCDR
jgi:WD40 repeat protein